MPRINLDIRQLRSLIAIAEEGSFSGAASRICLSQPALSLMVKQLEENIELKLFHRTTRKVELTAAGQEFLATARRVVSDLDEGMAQLRDYAQCGHGRVAVAALPSLASTLLPEAIPGFRKILPGVRIVMRDGVAEAVLASLRAGEVDLALGFPLQDADDLTTTHLLMDELVAIAPADGINQGKEWITWADLCRHPFIAMASSTSIRRLTDQAFAKLGAHPEVAFEVSYMTSAIALVENREGFTILPSSFLPSTLPRHLTRLELRSPKVERQISILERKGRHRTPAAESLIRYLLDFTRNWRTNRLS